MKVLKSTTLMAMAFFSIIQFTACKDNQKNDGKSEKMNKTSSVSRKKDNSSELLTHYMSIKKALANDNKEKAAKHGSALMESIKSFDKSSYSDKEQKTISDIFADASEHAEHISESPLPHQREHFSVLSKDFIDLVKITGNDKKLYQDFCPMYNDGNGAQWLSYSEPISNPYMGSKMPKCGKVQKEIAAK